LPVGGLGIKVIRPEVPVTREVDKVVVLPGLKKETEKERPRPERLMSRVGVKREREEILPPPAGGREVTERVTVFDVPWFPAKSLPRADKERVPPPTGGAVGV
jgi:hypothetical protein